MLETILEVVVERSPSSIGDLARAASVATLSTQHLVPDGTQIHHLSTFEVLSALNPVCETVTPPREDQRSWRRRALDKIEDLGSFFYRSIPHGIKSNRLAIQWVSISSVSAIPLFIRPPDHWFWGPIWAPMGAFICINSLTTIEMATGGTNRNSYLRLLGTLLAAAISIMVLLPMILAGWKGASDSYMVRWIMYYACVPSPFIWNYFIYHFPGNIYENFTLQGLSTQVYLFSSSSTLIVYDMCICTLGCFVGTVLGFVGYQIVLPLRARDKLTHETSLIAFKLSYSLEPLIEFGSGVMKGRHEVNPVYGRSTNQVRQWRANGGRGELLRQGSRLAHSISRILLNPKHPPPPIGGGADVAEILLECSKLMESHEEVLNHARREHYWSQPHFFYHRQFKEILADCRALYYHVTSLFLCIKTPLATPGADLIVSVPRTGPASTHNDYGGLFDLTDNSHSQGPRSINILETRSVNVIPVVTSESECESAGVKTPVFYSPAEALAAAKAPVQEMLRKLPVMRQQTLPDTPRSDSSLEVMKHAATSVIDRRPKFTAATAESVPAVTDRGLKKGSKHRKSITFAAELEVEKTEEIAKRQEVMAIEQQERENTCHTLSEIQKNINAESLTVPVIVPSASSLSPPGTTPVVSPSSTPSNHPTSKHIRVAGELEILIKGPSDVNEVPPVDTAKVIGLTPVVKWACVFGPLVGDVARTMATVLELIGEALDQRHWNDEVWIMIKDMERNLAKLVREKREWWSVSEMTAGLICHEINEPSRHRNRLFKRLEENFLIPWLGLNLEAYRLLPVPVKDELWVSFENMQDRQVVAIKTCVALMKRLKGFALHTEEYLSLQFPRRQSQHTRTKFDKARTMKPDPLP